MYIYKFTHLESERCYIGQTVQDPNPCGPEVAAARRKSMANTALRKKLNMETAV